MSRKLTASFAAVLGCALILPHAVSQSPADQLSKSSTLYANLSAKGLAGFHCNVSVDWGRMFNSIGKPDNTMKPVADALSAMTITADENLRQVASCTGRSASSRRISNPTRR